MAKRKRKRSRAFGSTPAIHTQQATYASENIGYAIAQLTNKTRNGKCRAASAVYAEMMMHYGEYLAHKKAGGRPSAPSHEALIEKATSEFNSTCLVNQHWSGPARRRRRKARR